MNSVVEEGTRSAGAPRRLRLPRTAGFTFVASLMDGTMSGTGLVLAVWLDRTWHAGPDVIGGVLSAAVLAYIVGAVGMGHLADRFGAKRMAMSGALLIAGTLWLLPHLATWTLLVAVLVIRGLAAAMFWPSMAGWITRGADQATLPRRMTAYNLGWGTGCMLGPWIAGALLEAHGAAVTFRIFGGVLCVAACGVALLPRLGGPPKTEASGSATSAKDHRRQAWINNFTAFFATGVVRTHFPQFGRLTLDWEPSAVGAAMAVMMAVNLLAFVYLGLIHPHRASGSLVGPSRWLAILGLAALALGRPLPAVLGLMCVGLHQGAAFSASFYHSLYGRKDASRQGGINEAIVGSGSFFGASLGGLAMARLTNGGWWLSIAVLLLGVVLSRWAGNQAPRPNDQ